MKIRIETIDNLEEEEIIIRCGRVDDKIQKIQNFIIEQSKSSLQMAFYKQNEEYYFSLDEVLFFETEGERIFAHTAENFYQIKYKLYELEELLPKHFVRIAKSSIVNSSKIYSISRNLTSSSLIKFIGSHKQVYVSRHYYGQLKHWLTERSLYEK